MLLKADVCYHHFSILQQCVYSGTILDGAISQQEKKNSSILIIQFLPFRLGKARLSPTTDEEHIRWRSNPHVPYDETRKVCAHKTTQQGKKPARRPMGSKDYRLRQNINVQKGYKTHKFHLLHRIELPYVHLYAYANSWRSMPRRETLVLLIAQVTSKTRYTTRQDTLPIRVDCTSSTPCRAWLYLDFKCIFNQIPGTEWCMFSAIAIGFLVPLLACNTSIRFPFTPALTEKVRTLPSSSAINQGNAVVERGDTRAEARRE